MWRAVPGARVSPTVTAAARRTTENDVAGAARAGAAATPEAKTTAAARTAAARRLRGGRDTGEGLSNEVRIGADTAS
jgi:hypothetical protein